MSQLVGTPGPVLTERDIEHRTDFECFVHNDSDRWHKELLGRLYRHWHACNAAYFDGSMVQPYILMSDPGNPRSLGCAKKTASFGGKSEIVIRRSIPQGTYRGVGPGEKYLEGRMRFCEDILLHEMIHQYQQEVSHIEEESFHGHGPHFRDHCNRIGEQLALPAVRSAKKRGKDADLPSCAHWPHIVRPPEYYLGAYTSGADVTVTGTDEQDSFDLATESDRLARFLAKQVSRWPREYRRELARIVRAALEGEEER